jgi:hypothetical protein
MSLYPTPDQIRTFLEGDDGAPIVMVNLLRFHPKASSPDEGVSGEEAYHRYSDRMLEFIGARGARVLYSGHLHGQVIGEDGAQFHAIALVEYPSRREFLEIATHPYVREIGVHRAAGLAGQWLLAATTDA